jgi:hypothetical protein
MFHPMMRWALDNSLQKRRILACSLLLAVLACAALPGVSQASRTFRGVGFSTIVPSAWKIGNGKQGDSRLYGASSRQSKANSRVNSMQLGVSVVPVTDLERQLGRKLPATPAEILGLLLTPPQDAQNVTLSAPIRSSTLGGRAAASGAVQFFSGGAQVLQSETVSVYRKRIYLVAYNIDQSLQYKALPILARVHRHWRWR